MGRDQPATTFTQDAARAVLERRVALVLEPLHVGRERELGDLPLAFCRRRALCRAGYVREIVELNPQLHSLRQKPPLLLPVRVFEFTTTVTLGPTAQRRGGLSSVDVNTDDWYKSEGALAILY